MPDDPASWTAEREWIKANLQGTWVSAYGEELVLSADDMSFSFGDPEYFVTKGTVQQVTLFGNEENSGMIFIKYNEPQNEWDGASIVGDYIGYHFSSLTKNTLELSIPSDDNYRTPAQPTLEAAINTFTVDTLSDYFAKSSTMTKQP